MQTNGTTAEAPHFEPRHCTLCGPSTSKKLFCEGSAFQTLNSETFSSRNARPKYETVRRARMVKCASCEMVYLDPAPTTEKLSDLYLESGAYYGDLEGAIYDSYSRVLDRALAMTKNRGTFVEIGGASGFMLRYGADKGFKRLIEIEPSKDAEAHFVPPSENALFIRSSFRPTLLSSGSASLVCFFQVLDHVSDPRAFIRGVFDILEPGGIAIAVNHNTKAVTSRLLGNRSPIYDCTHTYLFHPGNMTRLFETVGFKVAETFGVVNRYPLDYWASIFPAPAIVKQGFRSAVKPVSSWRVPLRAGNFGLIAYKP